MYRFLKKISNTDHISVWKSKGLSDEIIEPSSTSDNSLLPALSYFGNKTRAKFYGSCLKQDKITFTHRKIVNIVYEINLWSYVDSSDTTLRNSLFGATNKYLFVNGVEIHKFKAEDSEINGIHNV